MKFFSIFTVLVCCVLGGCDAVNPFSAPEEVSMSEIVTDTINGGNRYENEEITIKATVELGSALLLLFGSIILETGRSDVNFYVTVPDGPEKMNKYQAGESYTFKLYIEKIEPDSDGWNIWASEI